MGGIDEQAMDDVIEGGLYQERFSFSKYSLSNIVKLKHLFPDEYKKQQDERWPDWDFMIMKPTENGVYCQAYIVVVEKDGKEYGFEIGLHPEEGYMDDVKSTWASPLNWDTEVELYPLVRKQVETFELIYDHNQQQETNN